MTPAIDTMRERLPDAKRSGRDRWRCACPVCGGNNKSTLSIGIRDDGAVLLKCFKSGCDVASICSTLGIEVGDLFPERVEPGGGAPALKRRRMLTAQQALELLYRDAMLFFVVCSDIGQGKTPSETDRKAVAAAARRVLVVYEGTRV